MQKEMVFRIILIGLLLVCFPMLCRREPGREKENAAEAWQVQLQQQTCFPGQIPAETGRLETGSGDVLWDRYEAEGRTDFVYRLPNGDLYWQQASGAQQGGYSLDIPSAGCRARYFDRRKQAWVVLDAPKRWKTREMVFLSFDGFDLLLVPPQAYRPIENDCLFALERRDGAIRLERRKDGSGWHLTWGWQDDCPSEEVVRHWLLLVSEAPLVDWSIPTMESIWSGYQITGTFRWCGSGMFQEAPENVRPGGKHVFFLNPASYIPARCILTGGSRAADDLGQVMLDRIRAAYCDQGFVPVSLESLWLSGDYGIGPGYFDTRWNTDLAEAYWAAGEKFHIPPFRETALHYADFLVKYIREQGFSLAGKDGVLVPDYTGPGQEKRTHASLNHMLAELRFLYTLADHTGTKAYASAADQVLAGIESLGAAWQEEDGNLRYGVTPTGVFVGQDYPYLTYNDLFLLQRCLEETGRVRSVVLDRLIQGKLAWMEQQGVEGFMR